MSSRRRRAPRTAFRARSWGRPRHPDDLRPPAQALDDPHPGDVGVSGSRHRARAGDATIAAGSATRGGRTRGEDTHPMFKVGYEVRRRARKKGRPRWPSARLDADFPPARCSFGFGPYPQICGKSDWFPYEFAFPCSLLPHVELRDERFEPGSGAARPSLVAPHSSFRARRSPAWTRDGRPREDKRARDRLRLLLTPVPSSPTPAP
jgi:hypothetical protein